MCVLRVCGVSHQAPEGRQAPARVHCVVGVIRSAGTRSRCTAPEAAVAAPAATKKPEEKRLEKRKRKEVYRQVHQQAVYVRSPSATSHLLAVLRLPLARRSPSTT